MGMSHAYGHPDDAESLRVLDRALELGINFWDTAEMYGPFTNEELLGCALKGKPRQNLIIATKFAWKFGPKGGTDRTQRQPIPYTGIDRGITQKIGH